MDKPVSIDFHITSDDGTDRVSTRDWSPLLALTLLPGQEISFDLDENHGSMEGEYVVRLDRVIKAITEFDTWQDPTLLAMVIYCTVVSVTKPYKMGSW